MTASQRLHNSWIWVGKTLDSRVDRWDEEFTEETLTFADRIREGDHLYYWQTGSAGGIRGAATIARAPKRKGVRGRTSVYGVKLRNFRAVRIPRAVVTANDGLSALVTRLSQTNRNMRRVEEAEAIALLNVIGSAERPTVERAHLTAQGQGFGSAKLNGAVEVAAIAAATKHLEANGWRIRSVERERCGYDLHCTMADTTLCVEVKGVSGTKADFIITHGELSHLQASDSARVLVVTSALRKPQVRLLTAAEIGRSYTVVPVSYRAKERARLGSAKRAV